MSHGLSCPIPILKADITNQSQTSFLLSVNDALEFLQHSIRQTLLRKPELVLEVTTLKVNWLWSHTVPCSDLNSAINCVALEIKVSSLPNWGIIIILCNCFDYSSYHRYKVLTTYK